jgi:hypothetical protein
MRYRYFHVIFLALVFSTALVVGGNADVNLYLCPPSPAYFSSLSIGDHFTIEVIAEADAPGVILFAFTVTWAPVDSVEFVRPEDNDGDNNPDDVLDEADEDPVDGVDNDGDGAIDEDPPELFMTGFFPPTDSSRLSGIVPNWRTQEVMGSPGATPEIAVFTASLPPTNYTGPDSLAKVTFRKLSASQPTFSLTNATAEQYLSGTEAMTVPAIYRGAYVSIDVGSAQMSGAMLSQATSVVVAIGGNDYPAVVTGDTWTLDIKTTVPSLDAQPVTVEAMQNGDLLSSITIMGLIRSWGWYESEENHSEHPADSDGSGSTDFFDLVRLGQSYNTFAGVGRYDFRSDYNADGVVNLYDLLILVLKYGG